MCQKKTKRRRTRKMSEKCPKEERKNYEKEEKKQSNNKTVQTNKTELLEDLDNVGLRDLLELNGELLLNAVTSQSVLSAVARRYHADILYTKVGPDLLLFACPRKRVTIFDDNVKRAFTSSPSFDDFFDDEKSFACYPPHVYSLTRNALQNGINGLDKRQLMIFSGEENTGKSLNFFHALDFLLLQSASCHGDHAKMVFEGNHLLNLFTSVAMENYDSTRCVKMLELDFNFLGNVVSSVFHNFYLEKFLTLLGDGGNNFQIFNVLVSGSPSLLKTLGLCKNTEKYRILKNSKNNKSIIPFNSGNKNSYEEWFAFFKKTMTTTFKIDEATFQDVLRILAAILHLGNASFSPSVSMDGIETMDLNFFNNNADFHVTTTQNLLAIETDIFDLIAQQPCPNDSLNSVMISLYTRLFSWLSKTVNNVTKNNNTQDKSFKISLLDYPGKKRRRCHGDEGQEEEDFEELLVNYVNEKIEHVLVDGELRREQENVIKDGVGWIVVDTKSPSRRRHGHGVVTSSISSRIDALTSRPISPHHTTTFQQESSSMTTAETEILTLFPCQQNLQNNLTKNSPTETNFFSLIFSNSRNKLLAQLFKCQNSSSSLPRQRHGSSSSNTGFHANPTTLTSLKLNMENLLNRVATYRKLYVRCFKTSDSNLKVENSFLSHQLSCHGVLDYLRVRSFMASRSWRFNEFLRRYKILSLKTFPSFNCSESVATEMILTDLCFVRDRHYLLGNEMVFLKCHGVLLELEQYRKERLDDLALILQKTFRCHRDRKVFLKVRRAAMTIQTAFREWKKRRKTTLTKRAKVARRCVSRIELCYIKWKRRCYLLELARQIMNPLMIPLMISPVCKHWPNVPSYLKETNSLLKIVFHRWRCRHHRHLIESKSPAEKARLKEKSTASQLFKNKKESYLRSLNHPFIGDYLRLRQNSEWRRNYALNNGQIVFADLVNKVARSSGKFTPIVLVVTTTKVFLLDARTLKPYARIELRSLVKIGTSPFADDLFILHVSCCDDDGDEGGDDDDVSFTQGDGGGGGCLCGSSGGGQGDVTKLATATVTKKLGARGDLILHSCHLIEAITKIYLVKKNLINSSQLCNNSMTTTTPTTNCIRDNKNIREELEITFNVDHQITFNNQTSLINFRHVSKSKTSPQQHQQQIIPPSSIKTRIKQMQITQGNNNKLVKIIEFSF